VTLKRELGASTLSEDEALFFGERFDPRSVFGRQAPLEVEIGSGRALFLVAAARASPEHDFLGLERSLSYYRVCRERVARSGLVNARVLRADGRLLAESLRPRSIRAFHVYFPDPWPKKKQRKRRLLDAVTLELFASRLEAGGALRIATDHADYGHAIGALLETVGTLERLEWDALPPPPPTNYERKYQAEGRPIWRFLLVRR
jgi:tRNA (guanine-N7-)-methyltransferase